MRGWENFVRGWEIFARGRESFVRGWENLRGGWVWVAVWVHLDTYRCKCLIINVRVWEV